MRLSLLSQFFTVSTNLRQSDCFRCTWAFYMLGYNVPPSVKSPSTVMSFERHVVSNQRQFDCLFNNLVKLTPKKTSKFSITGPLWVEYIRRFPHKGPVMGWRHISVMSNHRWLDYSFNCLSRLITKDESKLCISGFIVSRIWWPMNSPRKELAIQEVFSCHRVMHTNNTSTMIASIILVYVLHTYALKIIWYRFCE